MFIARTERSRIPPAGQRRSGHWPGQWGVSSLSINAPAGFPGTMGAMKSRALPLLFVAAALGLAGCVNLYRPDTRHEANSVVQFLYPDRSQPVVHPTIPTLRLPLRVGVAFVPSGTHRLAGYDTTGSLAEAQKSELMRRIAAEFKSLPSVESIQILPTTYLQPGGGFDNLDQLRALMDIDVIVLLAYDQVQSTSETAWSLSYWTIVGAYIVPAQKNDTHTLMEAVVYDIPSRSLLFRAPGISAITGRHATPVRSADELRADSARGYSEAAADLTANLKQELEAFKARIHDEPDSVRVEHKSNYRGGGALGALFAGACALLLAARWIFPPAPTRATSHASQS